MARDAEAIKAKTDALAQASFKLGEAMYKGQQAGAAPGDGTALPALRARKVSSTPIRRGRREPEGRRGIRPDDRRGSGDSRDSF